jgi:thiol-disulfide isomerase/thioredoxin
MRFLLSTLLFASAAFAAQAGEPGTVDAALARAKQAHQPVFIDFTAPWCYSCYYMASHVLNGPEWKALQQRAVTVEVDADSPDGAAWMKKLEVKALPAYVVLDEHGKERGRILAEQPRAKFYPMLDAILAGAGTLDDYRAKAKAGDADAVRTVLASYQARGDGKGGLDWYAALPQAVRTKLDTDAKATLLRDRLALQRALEDKHDAEAVSAAQRVLADDPGCDRIYVVMDLLGASESMPKAEREPILRAQKPALDALIARDVFVASPTCADQRSAVFASAELEAALGDAAGEKAALDRGIAATRAALGDDIGKDRNAADNLRVYLTMGKRTAELDALYPKLIAAYPDDYVYPYRWGRSLLERGDAAKALPLLEQAAEKAYGVNRLTVAKLRVDALNKLGRADDAKSVADEALELNGAWFPDQAAGLREAAGAAAH